MRLFVTCMLVVSLFLAMGCEPPPEVNDVDIPLMGRVEEPLAVDGSIDGYPAEPVEVVGADVHMAHDGNQLYVHMEVEGSGWLAVGFVGRGGAMDGANMVLGYMDEETPAFRDDVGRGLSHSEAGVTAVEEFFLSHEDGVVILEFSYPLVFPDGEGYEIEELLPGEIYTLIAALHSTSNNIDQRHSARGSIDFTVEP